MLRLWLSMRSCLFLAVALLLAASASPALAQASGSTTPAAAIPVPKLLPEPDIRYYFRPEFISIPWPPTPAQFCSEAEKAAFLRQMDRNLATAAANLQLAEEARFDLGQTIELIESYYGRSPTLSAARLEATQLDVLVDYHQTILDTYRALRARLAAMPISDCPPGTFVDEPLDFTSSVDPNSRGPLLDGYFSDPILVPPDPRLPRDYSRPSFAPLEFPPVANRFCSLIDKLAYIHVVEDLLRRAEVNYHLAFLLSENLEVRVLALRDAGKDEEADGLATEADALEALMEHYAAVYTYWSDVLERVRDLPVVNCPPPGADLAPPRPPARPPTPPAAPARPGYSLPEIPASFCSEEYRTRYLTWVFSASYVVAQAALDQAEKDLARYKNDLGIAQATGMGADGLARIRQRISEATAQVAMRREQIEALRTLEVRVRQLPIVPCDPRRDVVFPPSGLSGLALPAAPLPPTPLSAPAWVQPSKDPAGNPFQMPDIPDSFCTEAERLAYLTDVYHPMAAEASRAAVAAYNRLAAMNAEHAAMMARTPPDPRADALAEAIIRQRIEAARLGERARLLIGLRDRILRIPIVPCRDPDASERPGPDPARPPATPPPAAPTVRPSTDLEAGVLAEINLLRSDPAAYAANLAGVIPGARRADVEAAVQALRSAAPAPALQFDPRLAGAAIVHADDIGPPGLTTHTGTDGSTLGGRIRAQGLIASLTAEELSYGQRTARAVVVQMVIDAGVAGAPHRRDLLNPVFRFAGVGCGPHKTYRSVCVITLSGPPVGT